ERERAVENLREIRGRREPEEHVDVREPEIGVEQQRRAAALRERDRKIHRDVRLADAALAARDGDDLDRLSRRERAKTRRLILLRLLHATPPRPLSLRRSRRDPAHRPPPRSTARRAPSEADGRCARASGPRARADRGSATSPSAFAGSAPKAPRRGRPSRRAWSARRPRARRRRKRSRPRP